jgi:hypothetical protein
MPRERGRGEIIVLNQEREKSLIHAKESCSSRCVPNLLDRGDADGVDRNMDSCGVTLTATLMRHGMAARNESRIAYCQTPTDRRPFSRLNPDELLTLTVVRASGPGPLARGNIATKG